MSVVTLSSSSALPKPYTRAQLLNVKTSFQGLTVPTIQYGNLLAWGPEYSSLNDQDRASYRTAKRAAGDTHAELAISWAYNNDNGFSYPVPGTDLTQNLARLRYLIIELISGGFRGILLKLAGDGEGAGPGYNNPDGMSYGREWLMNNFNRIHDYLKDLDDYIIYIPGYDDIWYGWNTPQDLENWLLFAKSCGAKYLGLEFSLGVTFWQLGPADFISAAGKNIDVVLAEFDADLHQDSFWQIAARQLCARWIRPSDMPAGDDPNPPCFLIGGQVPIFYEHMTYQWVRGQVSLADVNKNRDYARACGYPDSCIC